jgi:CubicO group peptidase (beta-lactamase class C family)
MRLLLALALSIALAVGIYTVANGSDGSGTPARATGAWDVAAPAQEGVDPNRLDAAVRRIENEDGAVLALVVARHGRLVLERYFHGYDADYPFDVYSLTKSVTSAIAGTVLAGRLDARLPELLPGPVPARARKITLRQLLTMTAGFPGDADPRNDVGDPPNLVRALLRRPIVHEPGSRFAYDTPSAHLVSAVISHVAGTSEGRLTQKRLFDPLGIHLLDYWPKDDQGVTYGGTGLSLTARQAAKLGQLYLDGGRWHGRQLVPHSWVVESTRAHVRLGHGSGYGYFWWTDDRRGLHSFEALGFGGQMVAVVPKLDLVVTVMSDPAGGRVDLGRLLFDRIVPAARE